MIAGRHGRTIRYVGSSLCRSAVISATAASMRVPVEFDRLGRGGSSVLQCLVESLFDCLRAQSQQTVCDECPRQLVVAV